MPTKLSLRYHSVIFCLVALTLPLTKQSNVMGQANAKADQKTSLPELEFKKWSGSINVPDPVSVSVDDQGRVYATQTRRRKIQDLDIREHTQWIPEDVALSSVEEKRDFLKSKLAIGGDQNVQRRHVRDLNGDGQHDWRDLQAISETIYQLTDEDDDGTADQIRVFAEGFQTEVTGIAAGVLAYNGSVWATVAPDVWKLTDSNGDGQADQREVMAHGFGLHIAYAGHDMHGLTVGPDGKIYWSIGDKGINVTTAEGKHYFYPNQGGVMRCNPDGSDFEVFAHGLRNVQELAFDKYGNLFSVDNDADQPREKERFVYIVNGMDAGWRCNYQYRNREYNPWVAEKLWELPGKDHPAYIVPPLSHYVDGPAGFVYNPGTALSPEYYDFFFLTSAPNGQQYAFRAEPSGDSFRMVDQHQIGSGIAIVGWNWGPDGALYGADWDGGYPLDQKGSVVRVDSPTADRAVRREVQRLLNRGFSDFRDDQLIEFLAHQDQRVRLYSQFELVRRDCFEPLRKVAESTSAEAVTRVHAIWGLGQLARAGNSTANQTLTTLFQDLDYHVRGQAAKTFGESKGVDGQPLIPLLNDDNEYVRTLAALGLARHPVAEAVPSLLEQAGKITSDQHYLRHAFSWALGQCATASQLSANSTTDNNVMQRLCCVIALRHQKSPQVATYLNDLSDWVATEAARAIHDDFSIMDALPMLAESLLTRPTQTEALTRRAINANFRLGTNQAARRVSEFALDDGQPTAMRLEAVNALSEWNDSTGLDRVDGRNRRLEGRKMDPDVVAGPLTQLASSENASIRTATLRASQALGVPLSNSMLVALVEDDQFDGSLRATALEALSQTENKELLTSLCQKALKSRSSPLQQQAIATLCQVNPGLGVAEAAQMIDSPSTDMPLRQASVRALANIPGSEALLQRLLNQLQESKLNDALALDLLETLDRDRRISLKDPVDRRQYARDGGDKLQGEQLFRTHQQAQCSRCHRIGREGSDIGPELTTIGSQRDADYILRAIANPSADIDEKYRTQLYLLESGKLLKGVPVKTTAEETTIADSEGKEIVIPNEEILESKVQTVSLMPEMDEVLSPSELRDLVAYLRSLQGN